MGFEVIDSKEPSYSMAGGMTIVVLSVLSLCMSALFAYLFITGTGTNFVYGMILAVEFLIAGAVIVLYLKSFIGVREVSEDRKEELLW